MYILCMMYCKHMYISENNITTNFLIFMILKHVNNPNKGTNFWFRVKINAS